MTRHDPVSVQTATPPSRPAGDLAPFGGRMFTTSLFSQNRRSKFRIIGPTIAPYAPGASLPAAGSDSPQAGQIQKNP
jgi:hypothetical protein